MSDMKKEIARVGEILDRLEPVVQRHISRMIDAEGSNITLSVSSNIATSMIVMSLLMIHERGGDVDQFMKVVLHEIKGKFDEAMVEVQSAKQEIKDQIAQAGWDTCKSLH